MKPYTRSPRDGMVMSSTDFRVSADRDALARTEDGRVLVAIDGTQAGWDALEWAAAEASARSGSLRIAHAVKWRLPVDPWGFGYVDDQNAASGAAADLVIAEALARAQSIAPDIPIGATLLGGSTAGVIPMEGRGVSLIVIGRRHLTGRAGIIVGPTSWTVARRSRTPVVVVDFPPRPVLGPSAGRVVVGLGENDDPATLLGFAFRAALRRSIGVTVLHVAGTADARSAVRGDADAPGFYAGRRVDDALRRSQDMFPEVPTRHRIGSGDIAAALSREASGAALTVLGSQAAGRFAIPRRTSIGRRVVSESTGPIAIVGAKANARRWTAEPPLHGSRTT